MPMTKTGHDPTMKSKKTSKEEVKSIIKQANKDNKKPDERDS